MTETKNGATTIKRVIGLGGFRGSMHRDSAAPLGWWWARRVAGPGAGGGVCQCGWTAAGGLWGPGGGGHGSMRRGKPENSHFSAPKPSP